MFQRSAKKALVISAELMLPDSLVVDDDVEMTKTMSNVVLLQRSLVGCV